MRDHIVRVYTEPPQKSRAAEIRVAKGRAPEDLGDLPSMEGMQAGARRGWNRKDRNVRAYGLVRRWLRSRIGDRWDDAWSEICAAADGRTVAGTEFRDAVSSEVETGTARSPGGGIVRRRGAEGEPFGFYVDPEGFLRRGPAWTYRRKPPSDPDFVAVSPAAELRRIGGIWFEIALAELPEPRRSEGVAPDGSPRTFWSDPGAFDVVEKAVVRRGARDYGGRLHTARATYAASKRTLSRAELRARGLANGGDAGARPRPGGPRAGATSRDGRRGRRR